MRDLLVTLIVMGSLPIIFTRPHVGILMWAWISYMNPHRMSYGFAFSFPFAALVAAVTLFSFLINSKERRSLPMGPLTVVMILFVFWMNVTTLFALAPEEAAWGYKKTMKIQLMNFVTMMLIFGKDRIIQMIWVMTLSVIFFGAKGGVFTIASGGGALVWGPPGTDIGGNNELALALIMCIPLMVFLLTQVTNKWIRYAMYFSIGSSLISVIGTFSRGAFLAMIGMLFFLWLKSSKKWIGVVAVILILPIGVALMPSSISERYTSRMETLETYEEDASAMGRINAWWFAFHLANDRPLVGGGFNSFTKPLFLVYAPVPLQHHDAHSIYFEVLGEHGYVGLLLYLLAALFTWTYCGWVRKTAKDREDLKWAYDLATMIQVSVWGYGIGGTFLGLAYWDFIWNLMAVVVVLRDHVERTLKEEADQEAADKEEARRAAKLAKARGEPVPEPAGDAPQPDDKETLPEPAMANVKEPPEPEKKPIAKNVPKSALPPSFRKS